ncbi:MAG: hypothetical protein A3K09_01665 [Nitrospinae bacterium RIFCSPLOWO2_12_FULL_47_7]|nr:MAG: hypothetical protein A3K09_01665 [Nitrospinae bacterium RIFCSPLOWO2_12_FULL_47_7]
MPKTFAPLTGKHQFFSFVQWYQPLKKRLAAVPPLQPGGNKPITMDFERQLKALLYFHLEEHKSGRRLLQDLQEDAFACKQIAPPEGIKKSAFFEAINHRGLEEMMSLFHQLYADAAHALPKKHAQNAYRLVGCHVGAKKLWLAANRFDLPAEDIAAIYKLRWDIENFFGWWKRHLKAYHLIARTQYGLMAQILAGLIAYLLLAIYCHNEFNENVSIKRVRQLRNHIKPQKSCYPQISQISTD